MLGASGTERRAALTEKGVTGTQRTEKIEVFTQKLVSQRGLAGVGRLILTQRVTRETRITNEAESR